MNKAEKAVALHKAGYNCAQSVAGAFMDGDGPEEAALRKAATGFGLGMGGAEQVCGAVTGAIMACGLCTCSGRPGDQESRRKGMGQARRIAQAFREKNGSVICKELKGMETGKVLRSCDGCIADAAAIAEEIIAEETPV